MAGIVDSRRYWDEELAKHGEGKVEWKYFCSPYTIIPGFLLERISITPSSAYRVIS